MSKTIETPAVQPPDKVTSSDVASDAAKLLGNPRTSRRVKSVAASALAQRAPASPTKVTKPKKGRGVRSFKAGKDL